MTPRLSEAAPFKARAPLSPAGELAAAGTAIATIGLAPTAMIAKAIAPVRLVNSFMSPPFNDSHLSGRQHIRFPGAIQMDAVRLASAGIRIDVTDVCVC